MATATLAHASILEFPSAVPQEQITQRELHSLTNARAALARLEREISRAEALVIERMRAGASVEAGLYSADVRRSLRRTPPWKSVTKRLARRLGLDPDAYVSSVIVRTRPSESFSLEIR
jgi:hypothetical protein